MKTKEASVETVIPSIPLPIMTNNRRFCETSIIRDHKTSIVQDQERMYLTLEYGNYCIHFQFNFQNFF